MSVATGDIVLWVALLLVIGIIGFFVMCVVQLIRFLGFLGRLLFGRSREPGRFTSAERDSGRRICS